MKLVCLFCFAWEQSMLELTYCAGERTCRKYYRIKFCPLLRESAFMENG